MGSIKDKEILEILKFYTNEISQNNLRLFKVLLSEIINKINNFFFFFFKYDRTTKKTIEIYDNKWALKNNTDWFSPNNNLKIHHYGYKLYLVSSGLTQRIWQNEMIRKIHEIKPKNVLEIGSGNGINLKILSTHFSEINFVGIDYSKKGIEKSNELKQLELLEDLHRPLKIDKENLSSNNLSFYQANANNLSFKNDNFDLVFSVLALEQMNNIAKEVYNEIKRCSAKHIILIEPFKNLNSFGLKFLHHKANKYLSLKTDDFIDENLSLIEYKSDYPHKISLGVGLLHLKK